MKKNYLFPALAFLFLLSSCFYDNKEDLFLLEDECNLENVSYSVVIQPLIEQRCYVCHSTANKFALGAGIDVEDFDELKNIVGVDGEGIFIRSIRREAGVSPMPQGAGKIPDCEIMQLEKWIENGALND